MFKKFMMVLIILSLPSIGSAKQPLTYDRVNFSVSVNEEVENDTVTAILYAQREGSDSGTLDDSVNKDITWAIELVKEVPDIKVQTRDYQTNPIYSKQTLTGWRVRQSISLETKEIKTLSGLLGKLQERIAIQSISYSISPERRQTVEDQLITEALSQFKSRANLVTRELNRPVYRIVNLDINTGNVPPAYPMARGAMMMAEKASVSPPALEAGTNTITVTVNGTIELQVQ